MSVSKYKLKSIVIHKSRCHLQEPGSASLDSKEVEKDALATAAEEWLKLTHSYANMTRNAEARILAKSGHYREALQLWKRAADDGYNKAHYNVALCYEQGKGTKADISKVTVMSCVRILLRLIKALRIKVRKILMDYNTICWLPGVFIYPRLVVRFEVTNPSSRVTLDYPLLK